jgi:hypothetical protein
MIPTKINHKQVLFFDIETVRGANSVFQLNKNLAIAWQSYYERSKKDFGDLKAGEVFKRDGALFPEFGKIVCVSMGYFNAENEMTIKAYVGDDEKELLTKVSEALSRFSSSTKFLCGHNSKKFDVPYLIRRATILNVHLPITFHIYGLKPWEMTYFLDTKEIWELNSNYLGSSSLETIAACFDIPNPKEDMSAVDVGTVYYNTNDGDRLNKIAKYCNGDVITTAKIFIRFSQAGFNMSVKYAL